MARVLGMNRLLYNLRAVGKVTQGESGNDVVRYGGDAIRDEARRNIARKLNRNSRGQLAAATVTWIVAPKKAEIGPRGIRYARIHELGGVITPKRAAALFIPLKEGAQPGQDGLEWGVDFVLAQRVTMPQRAYLRPAVDRKSKIVGALMGERIAVLIEKAIR